LAGRVELSSGDGYLGFTPHALRCRRIRGWDHVSVASKVPLSIICARETRGGARCFPFRPVSAYDQPDQAAQSIRLNIKSQKKRRRNLPFAKCGQYLRASSAETVYPRVHQALATFAARQAPRQIRQRSRTIPSPRDQRLEFKRKRQSPFPLLRAMIRTGSRLPATA
jgi:hypothetical protein